MSGPEIAVPLTYYGRYLFAHSPTYSRWVRLTSKDIHTALHHRTGFEGQNIWFYLNHPIRWIRIVGVVVAYDDLETRRVITLDDGSGHQIDLISWKTPQPGTNPQKFTLADLTGVELHSIIKAKGSVNEFWGKRQILLKRVTVLRDTNDEVAAWAETTKFKKDVLCKPWVVSDEVVAEEKRKLTMNAEDEAKRKEKKRRRLEKEKRAQRKENERRMRNMGKENMLWDGLVEKAQSEGEQTKAKRKTEAPEGLSPKRKRLSASVEPVTASGISYIGRRRPPGHKPLPPPLPSPPLPPPLPLSLVSSLARDLSLEREEPPQATSSSFKGHCRTTPTPTFKYTPSLLANHEPIPEILPDSSHQIPPPPEIKFFGRRRALQAKIPQAQPQVETNALGIPILNPDPESTSARPRRRQTSNPPADTPASQTLAPEPTPSPTSVRASSFVGRRRAPRPLADTLIPNASLAPTEYPPEMSHRERWKIMKARREAEALALSTLQSSLPLDDFVDLSRGYSTDYSEYRGTQEEPATHPEPVEQEPINKSTYRGKRRSEKREIEATAPESGHIPSSIPVGSGVEKTPLRNHWRPGNLSDLSFELPDTISTFVPTPPLQETPNHIRQRGERPLAISFELPGTMSTFVPTPSPEVTSSFCGRRRNGKSISFRSELPSTMSTFVPTPSPEVTSSFRGRRRNGKSLSFRSDTVSPSPFVPPSGNPSQLSGSYFRRR